MRPPLPALALAACLLTGCASSNRQPEATPLPKPPTAAEAGKVVAGHHQREAVQFQAAERINVSVTGLPVEAEVRTQTGVIVDANKQASAQQIDDMAAAFLRATAAFEAQRIADAKTIADLKAENKRLQDAEMRATAASLRKWGVSFILIGVAVAVALKAIPLGATVGGIGFLLVSAAQVYVKVASHPWYDRTVAALIVGIVVAFGWAAWHAYKKGDLTRKALRERDRLRSVLTEIVPAVDGLKAEFGEKLAPWLKDLKGRMDWDDRQLVKVIRAEVETNT